MVVEREGMPSWSYSHVVEEAADSVHALVSNTERLRTGAACPAWVVNSSTYTGAAIPDANAVPPPTRTTARLNALNGETVGVGVDVETGVTVAVAEPDGVAERVAELVWVDTADNDGTAVTLAVLVEVGKGVPVMDGLVPSEIDAEPVWEELGVMLDVSVAEDDAVLLAVLDPVAAADLVPVVEPVGGAVVLGVAVIDAVVLAVPVLEGVPVAEGVPVHDGHTGRDRCGAAVTPRNTVLERAMASVDLVLVIALYAYSLVGEVAYRTNAPQLSDRPAREMIMVPDSSNMAAVGVCRVQVVPDPVYCAMLFVARLAVSVIQMDPVDCHTNPNGRYGYDTAPASVAPVPAAVGGVAPTVKEFRPPVVG